MTDFPGEADDQHVARDPDRVAAQPNPTPVDRLGPVGDTSGHVPPDSAAPTPDVVSPTLGSPAPSFVAGPPTSGFPGSEYDARYGPASGFSPPTARPSRVGGSKAGLMVAAAIGLVAVLGIGVAIGNSVSGGSSTAAAPASVRAAPTQVAPTTTPPAAAPGRYSMKTIASACDLLDPKSLLKWSATPTPPVHREDRPSGGYGGSLTCDLKYTSTSPTDGVTTDEAGIGVLVEFTSAGEPPAYDRWSNTGAAQPGWSTGTISGLGARNNWRGIAVTDPAPGASYVVDVQDSNVSVEVQVAVHRAPGEAPLQLDDLSAIAQSQARAVLDRLKQS